MGRKIKAVLEYLYSDGLTQFHEDKNSEKVRVYKEIKNMSAECLETAAIPLIDSLT
jgi:hypothetical protein